MEVTMKASLLMEKLWGMDFNTGHQGQWRNDVFNEQGAIVNCSGDICDGLWINGFPAGILDLHWLIYQSLKETEPESGSDTLYGAGDASSSQRDWLLGVFLKSQAHAYGRLPDTLNPILVKLQYPDIVLSIKTAGKEQSSLAASDMDEKGGIKPSGRISAEKAEMTTVSQEKMEDSRGTSILSVTAETSSVGIVGQNTSVGEKEATISHDIQRIQATKGLAPHKEF